VGIPAPRNAESSRNICRKLPPRHLVRSRANKRLARVRQSRLRARPKCILGDHLLRPFLKIGRGVYSNETFTRNLTHLSQVNEVLTWYDKIAAYSYLSNIDLQTDFWNDADQTSDFSNEAIYFTFSTRAFFPQVAR